MKNKMDAFAEIEKQEYTYDINGNIIFVKKPKMVGGQALVLDYELDPKAREEERKRLEAKAKGKLRLLSAKP